MRIFFLIQQASEECQMYFIWLYYSNEDAQNRQHMGKKSTHSERYK